MIKYNIKLFSHKKLFNDFVNLENKKKLPSRIILSGQEGIGKCTFALHFINYLFSQKETTKYNLNENIIDIDSISFNLTNNLAHPNFFFIYKDDDKKFIEIDQIRKMISFLNKSSFNNEKKIILIDGIEDLNLNSANSLLKSLEESNRQNLFILIHNSNKIFTSFVSSQLSITRCLHCVSTHIF